MVCSRQRLRPYHSEYLGLKGPRDHWSQGYVYNMVYIHIIVNQHVYSSSVLLHSLADPFYSLIHTGSSYNKIKIKRGGDGIEKYTKNNILNLL